MRISRNASRIVGPLLVALCVLHLAPLVGSAPSPPSALLAHELVHVRQFHDKGLLRFTLDYNKSFVTGLVTERRWSKAYRAIPAEVEARSETTRWLRESARNKIV